MEKEQSYRKRLMTLNSIYNRPVRWDWGSVKKKDQRPVAGQLYAILTQSNSSDTGATLGMSKKTRRFTDMNNGRWEQTDERKSD